MALWVRFQDGGTAGFGTLEGNTIRVHAGDMFANPAPTGEDVALDRVRLLAPAQPSKMIALWNNSHALGRKLGVPAPDAPLFFIKAASCYAGPGATVRRPAGYAGRVVFEGELGIVIGRACRDASDAEAEAAIFGYTCINDITASDVLESVPGFPQWTRAKSFDGFGPFGPAIATALRPEDLTVRTTLNGTERQNYPIADMILPAPRLVSLLSQGMTLLPADVICCGTSLGVGAMRGPVDTVEVSIDGIGVLQTRYENE